MSLPPNREGPIVDALLAMPPEQRGPYLEQACAGDPQLRQLVEAMLEAHEQGGLLLDRPVAPLSKGTAAPSLFPSEKPGDRIGRYKLLQQIGEGGCGVVYMAEQEAPVKRKVALKVIKLGMNTKSVVARFEAERQALALMDHPHIAKVLDAGATADGAPYFVMEYVAGVAITAYCDNHRLSLRERLDVFVRVCEGVQHAHQKGIIHRDLKPSNILVTERDGISVPKVIDFGIAKATGDLQLTDKTLFTAFEQFIGTPAYMSPEQARLGELDIDTRSDIYSLGVLLYELLTGQTPFDAKELVKSGLDEMRRTIREKEPARPSTRLSTLPGAALSTTAERRGQDAPKLVSQLRGDLDWIVMKCLEKDRSRRYETANALALDVQRFLTDEPVTAAAPSARYRIRKFVQRNRPTVIAATTIALVLIAGITVSGWLAVVATRARDKATIARNNEAKANQQLKEKMSETEQARRDSAEALQRMQIQKAEDLLGTSHTPLGIAYLGQVLRANPSNQVASARLVSALVHRRFPRQLYQPLHHEGPINYAQFSSDGLRLVTASQDKTARLWDAQNGQLLIPPLRHEGPVNWAQFSHDGRRVLTASSDGAGRVWDAKTGQLLAHPLRHQGPVNSAQFSPDGLRVVTASSDATARVWDAQTGQPLTEPLRHEGQVNSAQFSPDGLRVVTASSDETARVWDAQTGQPLTEPLRHEGPVKSAQFGPDGVRLVTASYDSTARVWDAQTGWPLTGPLRHESPVNSAQFSPDELQVVTASFDRTAVVWDSRTGSPLTEPLRHEGLVTYAQFSPDGQRVLTASLDKTARIWDARTGQLLMEPLRHEGGVRSAQFSPDGLKAITVSLDQIAQLWDVQARLLGTPIDQGNVYSAQFSPDGLRVMTVSHDHMGRLWYALTGQPITEPFGLQGKVWSAQFSPDGLRVVTASGDKTARVWDTQSGQPLTEPLRHEGEVRSAQFSPDGLRAVTASDDRMARVWDTQTGQPLTRMLRHEGRNISPQFSPNSQYILTQASDLTVQVWDAQTGDPIAEPLRHQGAVNSAQFSPDGLRVVTASSDETARVWDAQTGKPITEPLRHEGSVGLAQFSPDGLRVLTACADNTARVWDARTGRPLTEQLRHGAQIWSVQFSPDGMRIVTASDDKTARVWDAHSGQPLTEPLRHEGGVMSAQFSRDGQRVLTTGADSTAQVWEDVTAAVPVPMWFIDWAEAVGGRRFDRQGIDVAVSTGEQQECREQVAARTNIDFFTLIAKRFESDTGTRLLSQPSGPIPVSH